MRAAAKMKVPAAECRSAINCGCAASDGDAARLAERICPVY